MSRAEQANKVVFTSPLDAEVCFQCEQKSASIRKQGEANRNKFSVLGLLRRRTPRKDVKRENFFSPFTFHHSPLFAFTLAEVLITLGIIGVVAGMTLPPLVADYQKTQNVTMLKKLIQI